jgi:hypothetical protein
MRQNKSWAFSFSGLALAAILAAPLGCGGKTSSGSTGGSTTTTTGTDTGGTAGAGGTGGTGGTGGMTCVPTTEICDGKDNNCDGVVDEGCACSAGQTQKCYGGPAGTSGVGACKDGMQTCDSAGKWGACEGAVVPAGETCNNVDDDCNGMVDDGLGMKTCGVGVCAMTVPACQNGQPGTCTPGMPQTEVCDGLDNNCNGITDESDPQIGAACSTGGVGVCDAGTYACMGGKLVCGGAAMPSPEVCDGQDNNCDGSVDEGNPGGGAACMTGLQGVCAAGTQTCTGGMLQCAQNVMSGPEVCDGKDNNCNGTVDEGNPGGGAACMTGLQGVCAAGTQKCTGGMLQCTQNVMSSPEVCDGKDNNCNGTVDEGNPGGGAACNTGLQGVCAAGTQKCTNGMLKCTQNVMAAPSETCGDGLDNNCNGQVDEGCTGSIIYMTSSNGTAGFYGYNVAANTWATLPNPPVVTYSQITTDGTKVLLLGQDNIVYSYNPSTQTWAAGQTGPSAAESSSPIGFFKWTPNGLYYLKDGGANLKRSVAGGAWTTFTLPSAGSCAGTYDPVSSKLYIRDWTTLGLTIFSTATNTVTQHWTSAMSCGENSRTGAYYSGFFYERDFSGPLYKMDVTTGVLSNLSVTPSESHTATDVDPATGKIYFGPYSPTGTVFQVYNVATNTLTTLAPAPVALTNHSTIVLVK